MGELTCTKCGMEASYADANNADIRRTCGVEATPENANEHGGYGGEKHRWVDTEDYERLSDMGI